jgi:hypothetical protein
MSTHKRLPIATWLLAASTFAQAATVVPVPGKEWLDEYRLACKAELLASTDSAYSVQTFSKTRATKGALEDKSEARVSRAAICNMPARKRDGSMKVTLSKPKTNNLTLGKYAHYQEGRVQRIISAKRLVKQLRKENRYFKRRVSMNRAQLFYRKLADRRLVLKEAKDNQTHKHARRKRVAR